MSPHTFDFGLQRYVVGVRVSEEEPVASAAILHNNDAERIHVHGWQGARELPPLSLMCLRSYSKFHKNWWKKSDDIPMLPASLAKESRDVNNPKCVFVRRLSFGYEDRSLMKPWKANFCCTKAASVLFTRKNNHRTAVCKTIVLLLDVVTSGADIHKVKILAIRVL